MLGMTRGIKLLLAGVCCFQLAGCMSEAERTSAQLKKMSRDVGADHAVDAVADGYHRTIGPSVTQLAGQVGQYQGAAGDVIGGYEAVRSIKEMSDSASRTAGEMGQSISATATRTFSYFPQTEADLQRMIDDYNRDFAQWLKTNYNSMTKSTSQSQFTQKHRPTRR